MEVLLSTGPTPSSFIVINHFGHGWLAKDLQTKILRFKSVIGTFYWALKPRHHIVVQSIGQ